jgi:hypothetical protein
MRVSEESGMVRLSRSVYLALLIFYPCDFRQRFGAEMTEAFVASLREASAGHGAMGPISLWRSALAELFTVAVPLRLASRTVMAAAMSFLASFALVLLFFRAVT